MQKLTSPWLSLLLFYSTTMIPALTSAQKISIDGVSIIVLSTSATTSTETTTTAAAATSQSTDPPSYIDDTDFKIAILNSTNWYRIEHGANEVTWNDSLASYAANWVSACNFEHSDGPNGENLAAGYQTPTLAVDAWGNERAMYSFSSPGFSDSTGHFTQLVWKATNTTGCGRAWCNGDNGTPGWFVACEYWPPGNVVNAGEFAANVAPELSKFDDCGQKGGTCPTVTGLPTGEAAAATTAATSKASRMSAATSGLVTSTMSAGVAGGVVGCVAVAGLWSSLVLWVVDMLFM